MGGTRLELIPSYKRDYIAPDGWEIISVHPATGPLTHATTGIYDLTYYMVGIVMRRVAPAPAPS